MKLSVLILLAFTAIPIQAAKQHSSPISTMEEVELVDQAFSGYNFVSHDYFLGSVRFSQEQATKDIYNNNISQFVIETAFTDKDYFAAVLKPVAPNSKPAYIWNINLKLEIIIECSNQKALSEVKYLLSKKNLLSLKESADGLVAVLDLGRLQDKKNIDDAVQLINDAYTIIIKTKISRY